MNTAAVNAIQVDGAPAVAPPVFTGPSVFASTGQRLGVDPGWSVGTAQGPGAPGFGSTGQRLGVDPGWSSGSGV
jgi:hypothetical protein